jgi:serine/threonine-protein kinase
VNYRVIFRLRQGLKLNRVLAGLAWTVGGGALVGGVFVVSFFVAMRAEMRSSQVSVPDLAGLTLESATEKAAPDLVLAVVEQRNDPRVPSGRVIEQTPRAGANVRRGRKVKLILSLGGKVLEVPDLIGHAGRAVAIELRRETFTPGDEARVSHAQDVGRVIAQVPAAGTRVVPNSRVHRLVSDGPPPSTWVMPDLSGKSRDDAERWIKLCGFRRGAVRRVNDPDLPQGTVVAQLPLAGYPIRSKDIVELAVAE